MVYSTEGSDASFRLKRCRMEDMSRVGFWIAGPAALIITIYSIYVDFQMYPEIWDKAWLLARTSCIPVCALVMLVIRSKFRDLYADISVALGAVYLGGMNAFLVSRTGFGESIYMNAFIQLIMGLAIIPLTISAYIGAVSTLLFLYLYVVVSNDGISFFVSRNFFILQTYVVLTALTYFTVHMARASSYRTKIKLEDEIATRQKKIDSLVINEMLAKEANIKFNISRQVAHDIRSPLTALNAVLSQKDLNLPAIREIIQETVTRISDIAADILKNSEAKHEAKLQNLKYLCEKLIIQKRVELNLNETNLTLNCPADVETKVDSVSFERLLSNLINNSYEAFNHQSGVIEVNLMCRGQDIVLTVVDNGKGISEEIIHRLGEKGFTTKPHSGSGLGLSYCKNLATQWNGRLHVYSKVGTGTQVEIIWPSL